MNGVLVWLGVAVLGGAGSALRMLVDEVVTTRLVGFGPRSAPGRTAFPLGIFVVNITGAFVAGVLSGAGLEHDASLLALTAFVGGYTTFSTWVLDTVKLAGARAESAALRLAVANVGVSLVVGFAAALAGRAVGLAL